MNGTAAQLVFGEVVHARLRPVFHKLRYRVFSLLVDLDQLENSLRGCWFISRNRFNCLSFYDRDHGDGTDRDIASQIRDILEHDGLGAAGHRIDVLCYPRVFGYVFNPLTVYLCHDAQDRMRATIYEVNNTVGERVCYVLPVDEAVNDGVIQQACPKAMYVSPFTPKEASYQFHLRCRADEMTVGVALKDQEGALLRTHFRGQKQPLSSLMVLRALVRHPLLTLKVIAAIHFEALRLFLKSVPVVKRHFSPRYSIAHSKTSYTE